MSSGWTTLDDVLAGLRSRWQRGTFLRNHLSGEAWRPITVRIHGPTAADVLTDPAAVERWLGALSRADPFVVETRVVHSRTLGRNTLPARVRLDHFDDLVAALGVRDDVTALEQIVDLTELHCEDLLPWVRRHPREAIALRAIWVQLLDVIDWIRSSDAPRYIRDVDVVRVDTKFVEANQRVLTRLLLEVLPPERLGPPGSGFARRFGFLAKPTFTRLRLLSPVESLPSQLSELQLRTDELAKLDLGISTVFVVENEVSYLRFPHGIDAVVIFGGGFAVTTLEQVTWMADRRLIYWGDIDTHGFAILDQLRQRFPHVESFLMDEATIRSHAHHMTTEEEPTTRVLTHLSASEHDLYERIIEGHFGPKARLEQERIRFATVTAAVAALLATSDRPA